jgi:hypothetical protein
MLRSFVFVAALAVVPCVAHAQDTTRHDSSAVERKSNNTVNNAGEGVKQANDQVDNTAYKLGTDVKNVFRGGKKKKPAKPDTTAKRDSTPH